MKVNKFLSLLILPLLVSCGKNDGLLLRNGKYNDLPDNIVIRGTLDGGALDLYNTKKETTTYNYDVEGNLIYTLKEEVSQKVKYLMMDERKISAIVETKESEQDYIDEEVVTSTETTEYQGYGKIFQVRTSKSDREGEQVSYTLAGIDCISTGGTITYNSTIYYIFNVLNCLIDSTTTVNKDGVKSTKTISTATTADPTKLFYSPYSWGIYTNSFFVKNSDNEIVPIDYSDFSIFEKAWVLGETIETRPQA